MLILKSFDEGDKIVCQYYVIEHATNQEVLFTEYNAPTEYKGVIYTPVNGRFEVPKAIDFTIDHNLSAIHKQVNNSLFDERMMFGIIMRLKGWWG